MRHSSTVFLSIPVAFALALGCSDDTATTGGSSTGAGNTGGNGTGAGSTGGNGTGAGNTGGNGTGAGNTGGNASGGNGTGGATGTACDQACGFAATCGVPVDQCLMNLDCATAQGACVAACVNQPGVDCAALFNALQGNPGPLTDCVLACQGGTGGGGVGGGGVGGGNVGGMGQGGGGNPQACQACGQQSCTAAIIQCVQSVGQTECQAWGTCIQGCSDAACVDMCTSMHPGGAPIENCLCTTCIADCGFGCN